MTENLAGKQILFLAHRMYEYPAKIIDELSDMGARVHYFADRAYYSPSSAFLHKMIPSYKKRANELFEQQLVEQIKALNCQVDYLFVIGGNRLSKSFYEKLITLFPHAVRLMYQWDSEQIHPYFHLTDLFHRVYSFDPDDCKRKGNIHYHPLFFIKDYERIRDQPADYKLDLLHIGILHPDRYQKIQQMRSWANQHNLRHFLYLYIPYTTFLKALLQGKRYKGVQFKKLSQLEIVRLMEQSRCIVDFPQDKQVGLTMRTFEVLGANRRLITTNKTIKSEPIYHESYVHVMEASGADDYTFHFLNNDTTAHFFQKNDKIINQYRLKNWLQTMFTASLMEMN